MTQTRTIAAFIVTVLAALVLTVAATQLFQPVPVQGPAEIEMTRIDAIPAVQLAGEQLAAIGGTDGLTAEQRAQVEDTVDRVCEGLTAEVPVMVLADTLVREQGLTDEQARALVNEIATERC